MTQTTAAAASQHDAMVVPGGEPPFMSLDDYYVRSLGPRLQALLSGGYITQRTYEDFRMHVKNAEGRQGVLARATVAQPHPVQGERPFP